MTRVFEDLDTPGVGQPFRVEVHLDLVDAQTGEQVREAYYNGTTIIGVRKAPVDGTPAQWTLNVNGMARAQWELDLAPNAEIVYQGSPGGTYWRRIVSPYPPTHESPKKSTALLDVPLSDQRLILGDLVVTEAAATTPEHIWLLVAGDDWDKTITFEDTDMTGYVLELELRRSYTGMVRASATFDYTDAATGVILVNLDGDDTIDLLGTYVAALQQYNGPIGDPLTKRKTLAEWAYVFRQAE